MARPRKNDEVMTERLNIRLTPEQEALIRDSFPGVVGGPNRAGTADVVRDFLVQAAQIKQHVIEGTYTPQNAAQIFLTYFEVKSSEDSSKP